MQPLRIEEVKTKQQLRKFVDYPNQLYKDVPQFVPAFYGDDIADWDASKNPAMEYCEAKSFLAYRGNEIVGRIAAILSHRANEKFGTKRMRFSQVDFVDDPEATIAASGADRPARMIAQARVQVAGDIQVTGSATVTLVRE